jgi:hypothetical protein
LLCFPNLQRSKKAAEIQTHYSVMLLVKQQQTAVFNKQEVQNVTIKQFKS